MIPTWRARSGSDAFSGLSGASSWHALTAPSRTCAAQSAERTGMAVLAVLELAGCSDRDARLALASPWRVVAR